MEASDETSSLDAPEVKRESLSPESRQRLNKTLLEESWVEMFEEEADRNVEEEEKYEVVDETGECDQDDPDILVLDENSKDCSGEERTIAIDFIESRNEKKFEKLLKEEKIKTPFKRRYSGETENGGGDGIDGTESKRMRDSERTRTASNSSGSTNNSNRPKKEYEKDPEILNRRQKQIDFGKNTIGYDNYINQVPKAERKSTDPRTPQKNVKYSRRAWDGLIKQWRKQLHAYDPNSQEHADSDTTKEA